MLCFANAGSAEDMYTSEGTGNRRAPSPMLVCPGKLTQQLVMTQHAVPLCLSRLEGHAWVLTHLLDTGMVPGQSCRVLGSAAAWAEPAQERALPDFTPGSGSGPASCNCQQHRFRAICGMPHMLTQHTTCSFLPF